MNFRRTLPLLAVLGGMLTPSAFGQAVSEAEMEFWRSIKDSQSSEEFQAYIDLYPEGQFLSLAKIRLKSLATGGSTSTPATTPETAVTDEPASSVDDVLWLTLQTSTDISEIEGFLTTFPDSKHAEAASALRDAILASNTPPQPATDQAAALEGPADGFFDDGLGAAPADTSDTTEIAADQFDLSEDADWLGEADTSDVAATPTSPQQVDDINNIPLTLPGEAGYLGVELANATTDELAGLPRGVQVKVVSVLPFSSAANAGLQRGDLFSLFNGLATGQMADLVTTIQAEQPGSAYRLEIYRDGAPLELDGALTSRRHQLESAIAADDSSTIESVYFLRSQGADVTSGASGARLFQAVQDAVNRKTPAAFFTLSMLQLDDFEVTNLTDAKARRYLQTAANNGVNVAAEILGESFAYGFKGFEQDTLVAEPYLVQAADAGRIEASATIGILYAYYSEFTDKEDRAPAYLEYAANNGNSRAQSVLGQLYFDGEIVEQDYNLAVQYLVPAAAEGDLRAKLYMGRALADGLGTEKDAVRAETLMLEAAEGDFWSAPFYLANFYYDGAYAGDDGEGKSLQWFLVDAGKGDSSSSYALAWLYSFSEQVPRDSNASAHYVLEAIGRGNEFALRMMQEDPDVWPEQMRRAVQDKLQQKGLYSGGIDGKLGPASQAALTKLLGADL